MQFRELFLDSVPWKRQVLQIGARVPPGLRNSLMTRGLSALARRSGDNREVETNMGIDRSLRCMLPLDKGSWIFGLPDDYVGERGALELLAVLGRGADAVLDIGAHVGYYSYFLAKRLPVTVSIYYFEPDPTLFNIIDKNVRSNGLDNVIGFNEAVGATSRVSLFYQNLTDTFSGSLERTFVDMHVTAEIPVQVRSFDDFARSVDKRNMCVKVDIEGAEQQFADGARNECWRIADLVIEVLRPAHSAGFVQQFMQTTGMYAYHINDYLLQQSTDGTCAPNPQQYNWLFTRKTRHELDAVLAHEAGHLSEPPFGKSAAPAA